MLKVTVNTLKDTIKSIYKSYYLENDLPDDLKPAFMVWGAPGIGKSAAIKQAANELGVGFVDIRLVMYDTVDLRGIPVPDLKKKMAVWLRPEILPQDGKGIILFDEITSVNKALQVVAYQIIQEKRVGDFELPDGWMPIGAGNRSQDMAVSFGMSSALANRFMHFEVEPSFKEWKKYATSVGVVPEVISFLNAFDQYFMSHEYFNESFAFPTPRSWTVLGKMLNYFPQEEWGNLAIANVGLAAGVDFQAFVSNFVNLPDPHKILVNGEMLEPDKKEPQIYWALGGKLISFMRSQKKVTKTMITNFFNYISNIFPKELQVAVVSDAVMTIDQIKSSDDFDQWLEENTDVIL